MANSIGILNEGFKKYESIKPSFEDELYEAMKSLTERQQEWSDEDKHDNEILWGIRDKWQKRINAKLTPEEKEIIKKYNIAEPYRNVNNNLRVFAQNETGASKGNELFTDDNTTLTPGRTNRKINVPDRARKTVGRVERKDNWDDGIREYQRNYNDMKNALRSRKTANKELADLDAGTHYVDDKLKKAQKELDRAIQHKDWEYDYNRNAIDKSNKTINKLLKRESLSKKRMNESKYLTGEYAYVVEDIAYRAKSYKDENPDWDMSDCISAAIDDGLIYTNDQWTVLKELGDKDPIELLSDYAWEEFYNDIYTEIGDYPDEDLEESLKSKKIEK